MPAKYGWIIDKDHLPIDGKSSAGTMGPRDIAESVTTQLQQGAGRPFRMLDGDAEVMFDGRILTPGEEAGSELDFGPLDDFGTPDSGCTEIHYREGHRWVVL